MNTLKTLLSEVNSIGFWGRIFGWNRIKQLVIDALSELQSLTESLDHYRKQSDDDRRVIELVQHKLGAAESRISDVQRDKDAQALELNQLRKQVNDLGAERATLEAKDISRERESQKALATLQQIEDRISAERRKEVEERQQAELARIEGLKETWARHQSDAKNKIKLLCEKHTIQYVDKVPFRGEPDNTILVCNEFVVFDAKSPANDKQGNFPNYLRSQADAASKYADKENVRTDIFFVVPSNTLEGLTQTVYEFAKHRVFIISSDCLEPVMLNLKKIEEYEFAEQMSPEERENVCRSIGRLLHLIKRRLQVDNFFSKEALALAGDCENLLPADVIEEIIRMERALIMNPPQERSGKEINLDTLKKESRQVEKGLLERGVVPGEEQLGQKIRELPLYREEQ
jgi:hypothetical protein